MKEKRGTGSAAGVLRLAGAMIAWVIGSGFATGQELLQFFASFGLWGYGAIAINLAGFFALGWALLDTGYLHRDEPSFDHFRYFCGRGLGTAYGWLIPVTMTLNIAVLISGAGATMEQYFGLPAFAGSVLMAALVLGAYMLGFERLIQIVSKIGPLIILFSLATGVITVVRDWGSAAEALDVPELAQHRATSNWALSGVLYLSLVFFGGSAFFVQLGRTARSRREARYGAWVGAGALVLSIAVMSTAILLNAGQTVKLSVPVLYLAQRISPALGAVFSIVLVLCIFSASTTVFWTVCSRFRFKSQSRSRLFAVGLIAAILALSRLPFAKLVAVLYPLVGWLGLIFLVCVGVRCCKRGRTSAKA